MTCAMAAVRCLIVLTVLGVMHAQHFLGTDRSAQASSRFNFFDIELLKEIIQQEGAHNFGISPAGVKAVLAMLLEGADGNTAIQIQKVLRLEGNPESYRSVFNDFLRSLRVRYAGTVVELANQIFVSPDLKVQGQYQEILDKVYLSGIDNTDFTNPQLAATTINGWVSKNTHSLIRTLVSPQALDPQTKAMVVNALYFRGKWAVPFDKRATTVRCFHPVPTVCKNAYFMETVGQHGYANLRDLNAKALEVYYQGSKFSMLFLLPNNGIDELLRDLSYQPLNTIIPKLELSTVVVSIPRFSIEFETDFTSSLNKLGIRDLFTPAANLSGFVQKSGNVYISKVFQKTIIEIDEEGTIGAAATGAVAVPLQGPTYPRFQAARPFLFFVRDMETGNFLFEGLVEQPELVSASNTGSSFAEPNNPTVLHPVPALQNNPLASKIDETISNGNTNHQNGVNNGKNGQTTPASSHQPTGAPDFIHYPQ